MPTANQKQIFTRPPRGIRKIVLATNIAETSITIDDIVYVINGGKIKLTNFDAESNIATLKPEWVSLANARQRRGRAGRVQAGICYHLYTRAREMTFEQFVKPEILRTKLEEIVLQIKILELGKVGPFLNRIMEGPEQKRIDRALDLLRTINALDDDERLTPLGFHLAELPMDPQTGKMILLGAIFSCLDPVLSVAASLSFKDAFVIPLGKEYLADQRRFALSEDSKSDHLMLANAISGWEKSHNKRQYCWDNFLSESTIRMLVNMKKQFGEHLHKRRFLKSCDIKDGEANRNSNNPSLVSAIISAGLYPNVAKVKGNRGKLLLQTEYERRAEFHPKSVNFKETPSNFRYPYISYYTKVKSTGTFIHDGSMVSPLSLIFFGRDIRTGREDFEDGTSMDTCNVDKFIKFKCNIEITVLMKQLRNELNVLLANKINNPGVTEWNPDRKEGAILNAIVKLITSEVDGVEFEFDD